MNKTLLIPIDLHLTFKLRPASNFCCATSDYTSTKVVLLCKGKPVFKNPLLPGTRPHLTLKYSFFVNGQTPFFATSID